MEFGYPSKGHVMEGFLILSANIKYHINLLLLIIRVFVLREDEWQENIVKGENMRKVSRITLVYKDWSCTCHFIWCIVKVHICGLKDFLGWSCKSLHKMYCRTPITILKQRSKEEREINQIL